MTLGKRVIRAVPGVGSLMTRNGLLGQRRTQAGQMKTAKRRRIGQSMSGKKRKLLGQGSLTEVAASKVVRREKTTKEDWHSQPCQKARLSRARPRKRKAESFGGGGGGKKRKAQEKEEEEKKKQKLDKSKKELGESSSSSSASESSQGRSQPVKLTPAATAVEKKSSIVKEE